MPIKLKSVRKRFSAASGILLFKEAIETFKIMSLMSSFLPAQKKRNQRNVAKIEQLILVMVAGADCLDDMRDYGNDLAFEALFDGSKVYSPKAIADLLRSFSPQNSRQFNQALIKTAYAQRLQAKPSRKSIIFDIDSTSNPQSAKKMEGVTYNYKGILGLDTIHVFDELGLQYWSDVRPGNTHTAKDSQLIVHEVLQQLPLKLRGHSPLFRADSGYCKTAFFNACAAKGAQFVVCMRSLMYRPLISQVSDWETQSVDDPDRVLMLGGRECEIGETVYRSKHCPFDMRVIILRTEKEGQEGLLFEEEDKYEYRAWVTTLEASVKPREAVKIYQKRGHAENFIKEAKYGFDMKHYPLQKLNANRAFGTAAAFAYNLIRFVALLDNPERPRFAKAIRKRFVQIPCQVVRHAREICFNFMDDHFKEVNYWLKKIKNIKLVWATESPG